MHSRSSGDPTPQQPTEHTSSGRLTHWTTTTRTPTRVGTYTISAESNLNNMKDNYKSGGADYTGKTVSQAYTVTLVSDTVKIEANKDSVVRSKSFSVTVTGKPTTYYYVWVKGNAPSPVGYDDQPPMVVPNQQSIRSRQATRRLNIPRVPCRNL